MKKLFENHISGTAFLERQRARRRLPNWLRISLPVIFLSVAFSVAAILVVCASWAYHHFHPDMPQLLASSGPITLAQGLILFSCFLIGITLSLPLSNIFLWLIPPVRRILDENAQGLPGASFKESMKAGMKALIFVALPSAVILFLGIWSPWLS
ncbi:MAG: hypothetical protein IT560_06815 [Alphaproteobacteria bacterium]|nr:hypothetical protein [Alphaproteobacteria bacterium]